MNDEHITGSMIFERDTKSYHRFSVIGHNGEFNGALYFRKLIFKNGVPKRISLEVKDEEDTRKER